ncbi:MAG: peptidylprolyl isomerase [Limnochordales bacterium]|nr:peptidylprolyl isomerase [Limnochordales bacterium]
MLFNRLRKQMKWIFAVIAGALALGMAIGGAYWHWGGAGANRGPIAVVNGMEITATDLAAAFADQYRYAQLFYQRIPPSMRPELEYYAYLTLRDFDLLLHEARRQKIKVSDKEVDEAFKKERERYASREEFLAAIQEQGIRNEKEFRERLRESLMVQKLWESIGSDIKISDEEVARAYEKITASLIMIKPKGEGEAAWKVAERLANDVVAKARSGQSFATLAKTYSDDPSKLNGGDLGEIGHGQLPDQVDEVAFKLAVGQISDAIKGPDGYYIVKVTARKSASGPDFEKQKETLRQQLLEQKQQEARASWFANLQSQAKIEIKDPVIKARDLVSLGKLDEAIAEYNRALGEQDDPYVRLQLARVYEMKNDTAQMIAELERAAQAAPEDYDIQLALAVAYKENKQNEKALATLKKVQQLAPEYDLNIHSQLASHFRELGEEELAKQEEKRVEEIWALYQKQQEEAQKAAEEAEQGKQGEAGDSQSASDKSGQ